MGLQELRDIKSGKKKKQKKIYRLKRTPLKKKYYRIKKVAEKRKKQNDVYSEKREKFLKRGGGTCELKTPVCTKEATCVHHTEGRDGVRLTDFKKCLRSCLPCNNWVERFDKKAREMGLKKSRHKIRKPR